VVLSLARSFRRGHGALYDALAAGRIDGEKLAVLLTGTLPRLVDRDESQAWVAEHDRIGHGLLTVPRTQRQALTIPATVFTLYGNVRASGASAARQIGPTCVPPPTGARPHATAPTQP
jgi:hypothetical protein